MRLFKQQSNITEKRSVCLFNISQLTGIIQLARSPYCPTCIAPNMVKWTCPPRIMAKLSSEEKQLLPSTTVTVSLPALIRSASSMPGRGNGPCAVDDELRLNQVQLQNMKIYKDENNVCNFFSQNVGSCFRTLIQFRLI